MRVTTTCFLILWACGAFAQNTDIEALSGLQFTFGSPGARSLAMGGAFIGLADDASAAEANPAGLTILRKMELSIEGRRNTTVQNFVTGGTYPFVTTREFPAQRMSVSFASVVLPSHDAVVALYYHRPLEFRNRVDIADRYPTPIFFLGPQGPVSRDECASIADCRQHQIYPFSTQADVRVETYGIAAARQWGTLSAGAAVRYQRFEETAMTRRRDLDAPGQPTFVVAQTNGGRVLGHQSDKDLTLAAGLKWTPRPKLSVGVVYKEGASFPAPVTAALPAAVPEIVGTADFHLPTTFGAGVSFRPAANLTLNADVIHVLYSHLTDNFLSVIEYGTEDSGGVERLSGYRASDGTEFHAGVEYYFLSRVPFGLRAGWWRDPAHSITYSSSSLVTAHDVAAKILFPGGFAENHYSAGLGLAWPSFQIDAAYDTSRSVRTASLSMIVRR